MRVNLVRCNSSLDPVSLASRDEALTVLRGEYPDAVMHRHDVDGEEGRVLVWASKEAMHADEDGRDAVAEIHGGELHPDTVKRLERRYEAKGESAQQDDDHEDRPTSVDDVDEGMVAQWIGLDDGGEEARALIEEHGYLGEAAVECAREAALRGYLRAGGL